MPKNDAPKRNLTQSKEQLKERYARHGFGLNFLILLLLWTFTGVAVYIQVGYGDLIQSYNFILGIVLVALMIALIAMTLLSIIILIWALFGKEK
jgi:hypothetical protein